MLPAFAHYSRHVFILQVYCFHCAADDVILSFKDKRADPEPTTSSPACARQPELDAKTQRDKRHPLFVPLKSDSYFETYARTAEMAPRDSSEFHTAAQDSCWMGSGARRL